MKSLRFLLCLLGLSILYSAPLSAQVPPAVSYQAVLADAEGNALADSAVQVTFRIYDAMTEVYAETHTVTTDGVGKVVADIGAGTPLSGGPWSEIDWLNADYELEVIVDLGTGPALQSRQPLKSVFYALSADHALVADSLAGFDPSVTDMMWERNDDHLINTNPGGVGIGMVPLRNHRFAVMLGDSLESEFVANTEGTRVLTVSQPGWQSFTATADFEVAYVQLPHSEGMTIERVKVLRIYEGQGTSGALLFTSDPTTFSAGLGPEIRVSGVYLVEGQKYTLQLDDQGSWAYSQDDPYPGGRSNRDVGEDYQFRVFGAATNGMYIGYNGVGIGVPFPKEQLDVEGNIRLTGHIVMAEGATNGYVPVSDAEGTMIWTDPATINTNAQTLSQTGNIVTLSNGGGSIDVANDMVYSAIDNNVQSVDAGATGTALIGNPTGAMSVSTGDRILINVSFRFRIVNGSGDDDVAFYAQAVGSSCTGTIPGTGLVEETDQNRGEWRHYSYTGVWEVNCDQNVTFRSLANLQNIDDTIEFDHMHINAVKY